MRFGPVTCLSVSRTEDVKLLRLMSSIIGWSGSNPAAPFQRLLGVIELAVSLRPLRGLVRDPLPDLLEDLRLRHPHPSGDEALAWLEMQVVAGSVAALAPEQGAPAWVL